MSDIPPSRGSRAAPPTVNIGDAAPLGDRADNRVLVPAIEGAPPRPPSDLIRSLGGGWDAQQLEQDPLLSTGTGKP